MDLTPEEVIAINTQDTITPKPWTITDEQKAQIRVLLDSGMSPCDIFTKAFLPLEDVIVVQDEIAAELAAIEEAKRQADLLANPPVEDLPIIE